MDIYRIKKNTVVTPSGCWEWQRSCNSAGYGQLTENKVYWLAHRYAYACTNLDLEPTDVIRHQCHNTKCCNPSHLLVGTHKDNWQDSADVHTKASSHRRAKWSIGNIEYPTAREAQKATGISISSLIKYTKEGIFDIPAYRAACKIAAWVPKI